MAETIEQKCLALVGRIRAYPMSEAGRARILAEVDAAYRRERASVELVRLPQLDLDAVLFQSK